MVLVTDKQYFFDPALKKKIDLMINRTSGKKQFDNLVLIDGNEGYGKSTNAIGLAYYVSYTTGRPFPRDTSHIFFDLDEMFKFAVNTKEQIMIWDEASAGGLSQEWWNKSQLKLIKLLNIARKKKHFYIFIISKFYMLRPYIIDRAIGLIHVYARHETELGRFSYYKKKSKDFLYRSCRSKKFEYWKYITIKGAFVNCMSKRLSLVDVDIYDKRKDEFIASLSKDDVKEEKLKDKSEAKRIKTLIGSLQLPIHTNKELMRQLGITQNTFYDWKSNGKHKLNGASLLPTTSDEH